jgi:hypothetical protein
VPPLVTPVPPSPCTPVQPLHTCATPLAHLCNPPLHTCATPPSPQNPHHQRPPARFLRREVYN